MKRNRLSHGGRGAEATVLLSFLFYNNYAKYKKESGYLKVGRWSPCPVLQHPTDNTDEAKLVISWRTGHGGHRPTWRMHPVRHICQEVNCCQISKQWSRNTPTQGLEALMCRDDPKNLCLHHNRTFSLSPQVRCPSCADKPIMFNGGIAQFLQGVHIELI